MHYSVYLGLESGSGDLFAIYEWVLQFKTAKKGGGVDSRRLKQVNKNCVTVLSSCYCKFLKNSWWL